MAKRTKQATKRAAGEKKHVAKHEGTPILPGEGVIHVFGLGPTSIGVISVSKFRDHLGLDVRRYYLNEDEKAFKPTAKGLRIPADVAVEVVEVIADQRDRLVELLEA